MTLFMMLRRANGCRQASLAVRESHNLLKGPLSTLSGPAEIITNPLCAVKLTGESKAGVHVLHIPWPVGPELHGQDPWWDLGYRTGAALGVRVAEITQGRSRELDREQRKRASRAAGDTDWGRRRDRLPASCLLLLRFRGQDWGPFLVSEPNRHPHCAATFTSQLVTTVSLDPMK